MSITTVEHYRRTFSPARAHPVHSFSTCRSLVIYCQVSRNRMAFNPFFFPAPIDTTIRVRRPNEIQSHHRNCPRLFAVRSDISANNCIVLLPVCQMRRRIAEGSFTANTSLTRLCNEIFHPGLARAYLFI
jgi:hypothetical protein